MNKSEAVKAAMTMCGMALAWHFKSEDLATFVVVYCLIKILSALDIEGTMDDE